MFETNSLGNSGGTGRVWLCSALAVTLLTPAVLPGQASPAPQAGQSFGAIFQQYRSGSADAAVEELSRWDVDRVEREAIVPPNAGDVKSLAALALLLTEAGMKNGRFGLPARAIGLAPRDDWRRLEEWRKLEWPSGGIEQQKDFLLGPPGDNRRVISLVDFDVYSRTALRLIRDVVHGSRAQADTALLGFCRNWYVVAGSFISPYQSNSAHMPLRRAALVDFGDHPEILLLVGSYSVGWPARQATLRRVLALDPLLVEARVRLGHQLHVRGDHGEAARELERAVSDAHAASNIAMEYLGRLLLGRLHEDARRTKEAEACYKAAAALSPHWLSAHVALGSLRVAAGDPEGGWAAGRVALDLSTSPRSDPDPWYLYTRAQYWQARSRIEAMRMAVRP